MRAKFLMVLVLSVLALANAASAAGQDKASVQMSNGGPFHAGETITFNIKLNAPMPKGAHFDFRISPVGADEEIALGSGEPVQNSDTSFKVTTKLPENALPGEWHISVVWFFLPGAGWTHNVLGTNDLRFKVEGKPYPIPTRAEVSISKEESK